jgi:hypothetical protein
MHHLLTGYPATLPAGKATSTVFERADCMLLCCYVTCRMQSHSRDREIRASNCDIGDDNVDIKGMCDIMSVQQHACATAQSCAEAACIAVCCAVCRYGAKDFSEVRNPSALFMATVKTVVGADGLAPGGAGGGYHAGGSHRSGDRGHYGPSSGSYGSAAAAGGPGGPTPRSYPGYGSLGGADNSYNDDDQPPPPPRQYAAAGGLGGLGVIGAAAAGGPVSADGLSLLAGGAVLQQPGVQLMAPAGLAGIAPGTVIMAAGVGGVQQQYIVSAGGVLTPVPAGATVIGGAPGAGYALQVRELYSGRCVFV